MSEERKIDASRLLARYQVSTETTPNGDLMVILECPDNKRYRRLVPRDLKNVSDFVNRFKLDLLIDQGDLPRREILKAVCKEQLPDYLPGATKTTRYARLWEDRKLKPQP
ncbi:MAG: hypothetical protein ACK4VV_02415 [Pseudomonas sp.]